MHRWVWYYLFFLYLLLLKRLLVLQEPGRGSGDQEKFKNLTLGSHLQRPGIAFLPVLQQQVLHGQLCTNRYPTNSCWNRVSRSRKLQVGLWRCISAPACATETSAGPCSAGAGGWRRAVLGVCPPTHHGTKPCPHGLNSTLHPLGFIRDGRR